MDRISLLPNDFILQILSLLPTKDVMKTSVLSMRWRYLWKLVPKLDYIDVDENADDGTFVRFVDRSLLLNTAPVLESLQFKLRRKCSQVDIVFWIGIAVERSLRELNFHYHHIYGHIRLPQSLYTCGTLVVLKLKKVSLVDVRFPVCFQLLKTLHLLYVDYLDDETPKKLLSSCPILEVLVLSRGDEDNVISFSVKVPSLQRFIYDSASDYELVLNTPSLKYLKTTDSCENCMIEYMPEIVEAYVQVTCCNVEDILMSLKSLKRLSLCLIIEPKFPTGSIFHQLVHLELCTCETLWELLMYMLQHSPKLRSLKLNEIHNGLCGGPIFLWEEPSSVPKTLMFVLETFEWRNYRGWKKERDLASFILKHSKRLKIAIFSPEATDVREKYHLITELARLSRGSPELTTSAFPCHCREAAAKSLESYMDCISLLPNDFLLHILSLLPTKDVLNTSFLSKRWRYLWKLVPKLDYIDLDDNSDYGSFLRLVDRSLLSNTAPVLESLHFKLDREFSEVDIGFWIRTAVERGLRELNFYYSYTIDEPIKLPQSLYTCGTLVVLKLKNVSLLDVRFPVCFQLLKTLHLEWVIFLDDESPQKLLSSCPVLEDMVLNRADGDNVISFSVKVPSLQRFIYESASESELVLNTPSLKYLKTIDRCENCMIEYMPEIVEAHVQVTCCNIEDILMSIKSLKRLWLCLISEPEFPTGSIFHQLVHLELCTCETLWEVLMSMLQHSPKLPSLKLNEIHNDLSGGHIFHWEEPSSVPESLIFVLETFEWINYRGWDKERDLATFILKHSKRLKIAIFSPETTNLREKYHLITELARLSRGSTECELVFG
ncbi:FBD domain [Arabidopsis suecica]|uniref:FBD domain n=1 Tax=Arabidopsis suecica TaxID=45249 RepID=A0A8T1Y4T4_ARASU|nr:FBD domain [Arabidopsis suecica]